MFQPFYAVVWLLYNYDYSLPLEKIKNKKCEEQEPAI